MRRGDCGLSDSEPADSQLNVHGLRLDISQGNRLCIVFIDLRRAEIWYMSKTLPARLVPAQPLPTMTPVPTPQPTASPAPGAQSTAVPTAATSPAEGMSTPANSTLSPGAMLLAGVVPVVFLLAIVALIRLKVR